MNIKARLLAFEALVLGVLVHQGVMCVQRMLVLAKADTSTGNEK